ncbi:MAG: hypothetical protein GMKNLPBB_00001 [Myxococcota bacterium]|nr:hypothetical protein [Myxococcota bacterium]
MPGPGAGNAAGPGGDGGGGDAGNWFASGLDPGSRGDISFTLVWSFSIDAQMGERRGGPDIDLWIVDPDGFRLSSSREGAGLGPSKNGGQIDMDDRGAWGDGDGGGPERAFWPTGGAPKGTYVYGVRWYLGFGSVQYTLRIYRGSTLVQEKTGRLGADQRGENVELGRTIVD